MVVKHIYKRPSINKNDVIIDDPYKLSFPYKKIIGLIGAQRSGKDTVAQYLQESRTFVAMAFADKIKEEFGINIEEFENAKRTGQDEVMRKKLWDFSAEKRKEDPMYFINSVIKDAKDHVSSVVITDIRTNDELNAVLEIGKVFWVMYDTSYPADENGMIKGSKLSYDYILNKHTLIKEPTITILENSFSQGISGLFRHLEKFFFLEDIMDLSDSPTDKSDPYKTKKQRRLLKEYVDQYNISIK